MQSGRGRVPALDGVRGLAVLLVTVSHAGIPVLKLGAPVGVTLFFVLSGYLITGLLLREVATYGRLSLGLFYRRRALRLLPALFLLLFLTAPLFLALGVAPARVAQGVFGSAFYVQNLGVLFGHVNGGYEHLWSLSMEEQFYLLWPLLMLVALRHAGRRGVLVVAVTGTVVSLVERLLWHDWSTPRGFDLAYYLPTSAMFALLIGSGLAAAVQEWPRLVAPRGTGTAALVGILATSSLLGMTNGIVHSGHNYGARISCGPIAAVFSALFILAVTTAAPPRWLVSRQLVFFGAISYGLYLWHATLIKLVEAVVGHGDFTHVVVGVVTAFAATVIAWASFRWWEQPYLQLKDRARPNPVSSETSASG